MSGPRGEGLYVVLDGVGGYMGNGLVLVRKRKGSNVPGAMEALRFNPLDGALLAQISWSDPMPVAWPEDATWTGPL